MRRGLTVALVALGVLACARMESAAAAATATTADGLRFPAQAVVGEERAGWRYEASRALAGTRSEHIVASLQVGAFAPHPGHRVVTTPVGVYRWRAQWAPGDAPQGYWWPVDQPGVEIETVEPAVDGPVLAAGIYASPVHQRRAGTPPSWCYSQALGAWLSPRAVARPPAVDGQ